MVEVRANCPNFFEPFDPNFKVGAYLRSIGSSLADVFVLADDAILEALHLTAYIEGRGKPRYPISSLFYFCGRTYNIRAEALLTYAQAEQSVVKTTEKMNPDCDYDVIWGVKEDPGVDAYLSKGRLIKVRGERKMYGLMGCGIPDPGCEAPWSVERYIGPDRQIWNAARLLRESLNMFGPNVEGVEVQGVNTGGRMETVKCMDKESLAMLRYTPHLKAIEQRIRIMGNLGLMPKGA